LVDGTYDRLPALVDMDVLHCDLLLALAAMPTTVARDSLIS
jgi:hypothetical protein